MGVGTLMKHLTLNEGYIRVLDSYTNTMGCVLDVVRVAALGGSLGWAQPEVGQHYSH